MKQHEQGKQQNWVVPLTITVAVLILFVVVVLLAVILLIVLPRLQEQAQETYSKNTNGHCSADTSLSL
jgi:heme/copper-type cytochrome/quinol oxidase subunit 2